MAWLAFPIWPFCDPLRRCVHANRAVGSWRTAAQGDKQEPATTCCTFVSSQSRTDGCADVCMIGTEKEIAVHCSKSKPCYKVVWDQWVSHWKRMVNANIHCSQPMTGLPWVSTWNLPPIRCVLPFQMLPSKQKLSYYTILLVELTSLIAVKYWSLKTGYDHTSSSILT